MSDSPAREDTASDSEEPSDAAADDEVAALRERVEAEYDFENFGPADMAEMSGEEWEAAFDPDSWITGRDLLDRVEADLRTRIASRDVFAVLDRLDDPEAVVAYSDEGWAAVYADGSVEGEGTVLRDVKPSVALCSMESYEVPDPPAEYELPAPEEVEEGTGEFGNRMLQAVGGSLLVVGLGTVGLWLFTDLFPTPPGNETNIIIPIVSALFVLAGVFLFALVANARLSDRFRAEEYRDRLRAAGIADDGSRQFAPFEEVVREALADGDDPASRKARSGSPDTGRSSPAETTESDGSGRTDGTARADRSDGTERSE
ncbi:DUF7319 domain-containing protein [Candidatus Halobonum tyrrellensis]|uniref:DUF7319 domain-containing protein n=1 Tax=Candidatus Halobonum tyrrellensis G22 TaxID=1324957 RepID=V4HCI8_9EURY|nr:ABC transporter permease [Candidatus Halobonum tyrrellensis]ESP88400.1 hypothetical protein K933_09762 [Candidatus Halobonum tyrrellensis G22]